MFRTPPATFFPLFLLFALFALSRPAQATGGPQAAIGEIVYLAGSVIAERPDGAVRSLGMNQPVMTGDVIVTGKKSHIEIVFNDQSVFSQGAGSRTSLDDYVYSGEPSASKMVLKVGVGTFRYVTGKIVKENSDGFAIQTPLATIGIRGTEVFAEVTPQSMRAGVLSMTPGHTVSVASPRQSRSISSAGQSVSVDQGGDVSAPASTDPQVRQRVIRNAPQTTQGERPNPASVTPSEIENRIKAFEDGIDRIKEDLDDEPDYETLHRISLQNQGLSQAKGDKSGRGSSSGIGSADDAGGPGDDDDDDDD